MPEERCEGRKIPMCSSTVVPDRPQSVRIVIICMTGSRYWLNLRLWPVLPDEVGACGGPSHPDHLWTIIIIIGRPPSDRCCQNCLISCFSALKSNVRLPAARFCLVTATIGASPAFAGPEQNGCFHCPIAEIRWRRACTKIPWSVTILVAIQLADSPLPSRLSGWYA